LQLRARLGRIRRRLRRFRALTGALATAVVALLSTLYEETPAGLRIAALLLLALLTILTFLLTDTGADRSGDGNGTLPAEAEKHAVGRASVPALGSSRPDDLPEMKRRPALGPRDGSFVGRAAEIRELRRRHDKQRRVRQSEHVPAETRYVEGAADDGDLQTAGPVLLLIHGRPGVGKTALAEELARELSADYPDGQLLVPMTVAGSQRPLADILKFILSSIGWDERMPENTVGMEIAFRSLSRGRRIVYVFDGAQNAELVKLLLPVETNSAVIVTSRRDLTSDPDFRARSNPDEPASYRLSCPDETSANAIFRAISGTEPSEHAECAARIVEYCSRLPLALRSAGERIAEDRSQICQVADLLRGQERRLEHLDRPGRSVRTLLADEFSHLSDHEQRALIYLSAMPSSTFVPWVLAPLLNVRLGEAEAIVDRLSGAGLIEDLGVDEPTQLARYQVDGMIRLFARGRMMSIPEPDRDLAFQNLDDAYLEVVTVVLAEMDAGVPAPTERRWIPEQYSLPRRMADNPGAWIQREYANLVRVMKVALRRDQLEIAWRVGVLFNGAVPHDVDIDDTVTVYNSTIQAAIDRHDVIATAGLQAAKALFLAAIEWHLEAVTTMEDALRELGEAKRNGHEIPGFPFRPDETDMRCRFGESFLRAGAYREGIQALEESSRSAGAAGTSNGSRAADILLFFGRGVDAAEWVRHLLDGNGLTMFEQYCGHMAAADAARRKAEWATAEREMALADSCAGGDEARRAYIRCVAGELALDTCRQMKESGVDEAGWRPHADTAIRRAASARLMFAAVHNYAGELRAQCLLAKALHAAGHLERADLTLRAAEREFARRAGDEAVASPSLEALFKFVRGTLITEWGSAERGIEMLLDAASVFNEQNDGINEKAALAAAKQARAQLTAPVPVSAPMPPMASEEISSVGEGDSPSVPRQRPYRGLKLVSRRRQDRGGNDG
jgi:hypothetical protein